MLTRVQKWSWLKAWALNVAKRGGLRESHRCIGTALGHRHASDVE
jgi:hypothetical protein